MKTKIVMTYTSVMLTLAFGLIVASIETFPELVYAQANQTTSGNQTGGGQGGNQTGGGQGGNQTGGGQGGNQTGETGIGTVQELENVTGLSNQTILNNTDIERPNATTGAGLEKEQTTTD
jgi:hypothetical protein